jgi:hypothetical protein
MKYDTLDRLLVEQTGQGFKAYYDEKSAYGRRSLRRKQWQLAMNGDKTMLIWLGKQYLNQAEKHEVSGSGGGPIGFSNNLDLSKLTNQELALLDRIGVKLGAGS